MQGFGDMGDLDAIAVVEIGDGAGDFEDFESRPGAEVQFVSGFEKQFVGFGRFMSISFELAIREVSVVFRTTFISGVLALLRRLNTFLYSFLLFF